MAKMSSRDQLHLWTDDVVEREDLAEEAILFVAVKHPDVRSWTEQFYALVLERLRITGGDDSGEDVKS